MVTVRCSGEIDLATGPALRLALSRAVDDHPFVVVDLTGVTFCDSTGLHVLLSAHQEAQAAGGRLEIHNAAPAVLVTFQVANADRVLYLVD